MRPVSATFTPSLMAVALVIGSLLGCGTDSNTSGDLRDTASFFSQTSGTGVDTASPNITVAPQLYSFEGTLEVLYGEVDTSLSTVQMAWYDSLAESICDGPRSLLSADQSVLEDKTVPVFSWWTLSLDESVCGPLGPDSLEVGIGAWDPLLAPPAEVAGLDGTALYAAYLRHEGSAVFVFGVAGTAEQFNQVTPPVTEGPLPDGAYQIRPLHLLPMPQ